MSLELNIYYANWCGFCSLFHSEENRKKIMEKAGGYKGLKVNIVEEKNIIRDDISGFPSIKVKVNGKEHDYTGERSIDAIYGYLNNIYQDLDGMSGGGHKCNLHCGCGVEKPGIMHGGRKNSHQKYLKYKMKYLMLKENN